MFRFSHFLARKTNYIGKPEIPSSVKWKFPRSIHPGRLAWTIIMEVSKIIFLSKWEICRFHVNLPGCIPSRNPDSYPRISPSNPCHWEVPRNPYPGSEGIQGFLEVTKISDVRNIWSNIRIWIVMFNIRSLEMLNYILCWYFRRIFYQLQIIRLQNWKDVK